jgi:hypothetical protein
MKTATLSSQSLHDLQQFISEVEVIDGVPTQRARKTNTVLSNVPYQMCAGMKRKLETGRYMPGTFWKIVENNPKSQLLVSNG